VAGHVIAVVAGLRAVLVPVAAYLDARAVSVAPVAVGGVAVVAFLAAVERVVAADFELARRRAAVARHRVAGRRIAFFTVLEDPVPAARRREAAARGRREVLDRGGERRNERAKGGHGKDRSILDDDRYGGLQAAGHADQPTGAETDLSVLTLGVDRHRPRHRQVAPRRRL